MWNSSPSLLPFVHILQLPNQPSINSSIFITTAITSLQSTREGEWTCQCRRGKGPFCEYSKNPLITNTFWLWTFVHYTHMRVLGLTSVLYKRMFGLNRSPTSPGFATASTTRLRQQRSSVQPPAKAPNEKDKFMHALNKVRCRGRYLFCICRFSDEPSPELVAAEAKEQSH